MNQQVILFLLQTAALSACLYALYRLDKAPDRVRRRRAKKARVPSITFHRMGGDGCSMADFIFYWAGIHTSLALGLPEDDPEIELVEDNHIHLRCGALEACVTTDTRLLRVDSCNVSWSEVGPDRNKALSSENVYMDSIAASIAINKFAQKSNTASYLKEVTNG